jgi:cytochrome b
MQARAAGYALTYVTTMKLQLVSWTVVGLTAAKFKHFIARGVRVRVALQLAVFRQSVRLGGQPLDTHD